MNILNTDIIKSEQDIFWQKPGQAHSLSPKPVLIISTPFQSGDAESQQLDGILKAGCKLDEAQYNIVHVAEGEKMSWYQLKESLQPRVVLLFNVLPSQLGIGSLFMLNEINRFADGFWVPTLSLSQIMEDKVLKGNLWNKALKLLFADKKHGELV